jgi:hypothetical protein
MVDLVGRRPQPDRMIDAPVRGGFAAMKASSSGRDTVQGHARRRAVSLARDP